MPGPRRDHRRDVLLGDLLVDHARLVGGVLDLLGLGEVALEAPDRLVLELGGALVVGLAHGAIALGDRLVELLLEVADPVESLTLARPPRLEPRELALLLDEGLAQLGEPLLRRVVLLALEGELLELHAVDLALQLVDLDRARVDLHLQARHGLVDEVDGLVGQLPGRDVAMREGCRGDERGIRDRDPVVRLVAPLEPAEDRDRVLDRRLADVHLLEAALERGILLDVLAVLVERRRADQVQLAAREHRLQHVRGRDRALAAARAHEQVQFVDERDDAALGLVDLLEHRLQPLLELAAVHGARDEGGDVERDELLVLQRLGDVALDDALREPLDDGGLADAGLADEHGVVLRAAGEHLADAADLGVAPDDGVELALPGEVGEVHAELFEGRLLLLLRVRRTLHVGHRWLPSTNLSLLRSTLTRRRAFRFRRRGIPPCFTLDRMPRRPPPPAACPSRPGGAAAASGPAPGLA